MQYIRSIAVVVYLVLLVLIADEQFAFASDYVAVCIAFLQIALGLLIARWWALGVPFLAAVVAIPFGLPTATDGEPFPTWFNLLFVSPVLIALVASGVGGQKLWRRRRRLEAA